MSNELTNDLGEILELVQAIEPNVCTYDLTNKQTKEGTNKETNSFGHKILEIRTYVQERNYYSATFLIVRTYESFCEVTNK